MITSNSGARPPIQARRKTLAVSYRGRKLDLVPIGECAVSVDTEWSVADKSLVCRDRSGRHFIVLVTQRLFSERPLKVKVVRLARRWVENYVSKASPLVNGGFERSAA